jgi:hypothetical protein
MTKYLGLGHSVNPTEASMDLLAPAGQKPAAVTSAGPFLGSLTGSLCGDAKRQYCPWDLGKNWLGGKPRMKIPLCANAYAHAYV